MAVQWAFVALKGAFPRPEGSRRCIAVDDAKTELGKERLYTWAAWDVDGKGGLGIQVLIRQIEP